MNRKEFQACEEALVITTLGETVEFSNSQTVLGYIRALQ
jgi:hypothetical protein